LPQKGKDTLKLSRWVWIGLLASLIWAVAAAVHNRNSDVKTAKQLSELAYKVCIFNKEVDHDSDLSSCIAKREKTAADLMEGSFGNAALLALGPIPFAWLAIFIGLYVIRAQIIGFRAVVPWKTLAPRKKAFVVLCCVGSGVLVLIGLVTAMNLYVDTKVPVGMSSFQDLTKTADGSVTVTGTWTRTDLTDDTIQSPLQTSKIECDKAANRCTEALASVSGTALMVDLFDYDIQSWTPDAIVLRKDDLCTTELFTIDLNTKAVTGAGNFTNETNAYCARNQSDKKTWTYQLSNGFKTYWEIRQKARPLPLRVIYSLFGN
jgi:hypothetical protein